MSHVEDEGWKSKQNGELLSLMIKAGFDVFITLDSSIQYQQNLRKYPIPIIVLRRSKKQIDSLSKFAPAINLLLKRNLKPGTHELTLD